MENTEIRDLINEITGLSGKIISFKRIGGNSLILYFDGTPGEANIRSLWLDPPWKYENSMGIIVDSDEFPFEQNEWQSDRDYSNEFERICRKTDDMLNSKLKEVKITKNSNELILCFDNGHILSNSNISNDEFGWAYRNTSKNVILDAFKDHFEKREIKKVN